jgi:hypothetical protein
LELTAFGELFMAVLAAFGNISRNQESFFGRINFKNCLDWKNN